MAGDHSGSGRLVKCLWSSTTHTDQPTTEAKDKVAKSVAIEASLCHKETYHYFPTGTHKRGLSPHIHSNQETVGWVVSVYYRKATPSTQTVNWKVAFFLLQKI